MDCVGVNVAVGGGSTGRDGQLRKNTYTAKIAIREITSHIAALASVGVVGFSTIARRIVASSARRVSVVWGSGTARAVGRFLPSVQLG
jgi:hypothetical protein